MKNYDIPYLFHNLYFIVKIEKITFHNSCNLGLFTCIERRGALDPKWVLVELQTRYISHQKAF